VTSRLLAFLTGLLLALVALAPAPVAATGSGVGNVPQGTQANGAYASSFSLQGVTNTFVTSQQTSCYTPEVPYAVNLGPTNGYSGETRCPGATTGENLGPYPTQQGSNPPYPASTPMLAKDFSESDLRVDPTDSRHVIGSSKWFVSPEGYNHVLGFYESFDGGVKWPVQGHIPGYEGWTDNTDPVGAFDAYGNFYELILPYQFFYDANGTHDFQVGTSQEPNPARIAEVIAVSVRKHGTTGPSDWSTANGQPDIVSKYDSRGNEPDKQWIAIDTNRTLPDGGPNPNFQTVYAMWVVFNGFGSKPVVATAHANPDGTHTPWSSPLPLPTVNGTAGNTYLLPHVAPDGVVYTPVTNFPSANQKCCISIGIDISADGGRTWQGPLPVTPAQQVQMSPPRYANTTFRSGIANTFAVGNQLSVQGHYPLYAAWEDASAGVTNVIMSASFDGGQTWSNAIQVNDNQSAVDEFQPNLTVSARGRVSVAFYDRRLTCPAANSAEAAGAALALDTSNPAFSGSLPPYNVANYCVNASVQFYDASLMPLGRNVRLTQHTWDPQLNAPHTGSAFHLTTFIGDYFGNITSGNFNLSSFVSTFNDGSNPANQQQQVIASVPIP
jgi:hypothetical protein